MSAAPAYERLLRCGRAVPWLSLAASLFALFLATGSARTESRYALVPGELLQGEVFRLWTGHFVHYNAEHLVGDVLAFAVWAAAVERASRRLLAVTLFCGTPLLSVAILVACPELGEYRGLSGLDCALVAELVLLRGFGVGTSKKGAPPSALRSAALVSVAAFAAKCVYEFASGHALFARDLGPGVVLVAAAHPLGALVGLTAVGACFFEPRRDAWARAPR